MRIKNSVLIGEYRIVLVYIAWGLLVLYWKLFSRIDATAIAAHRVVWSVIFCAIVLAIQQKLFSAFRLIRGTKLIGAISIAAILTATNWVSYLYALRTGRTLEAALAYFISSLMTVALGAILHRESIRRPQAISLALIVIGVLIRCGQAGSFPWLALVMAGSFSGYILVRRRLSVDALSAQFVEMLLLVVPASGFLFFGDYLRGLTPPDIGLLATCGAVTVAPMLLFASALREVSMGFIGMTQYAAPTLTFVIAIAVLGEPIDRWAITSFMYIWIGIACSWLTDSTVLKRRVPKGLAAT